MKAISLWQPWASAIAIGSKRIETRSWSTNYRGPIAIHAAKRCVVEELIEYQCCWNWCGALRPLDVRMARGHLWEILPFGAIIAVADLTDCRPSESFTLGEIEEPRLPDGEKDPIYSWTERMMGDFGPGRYGWILENVRALREPVPFRGAQAPLKGRDDLPEEAFEVRGPEVRFSIDTGIDR